MADFLVEQTAIGPVTRIDRLDDGRVACCICFERFFWPHELYVDPDGQKWDICIGCGAMENIPAATWPG